MVRRGYFLILVAVAIMLISLSSVFATIDFNGKVRDTNGNVVKSANVTLKVINQQGWSTVGYESNISSADGSFNITITLADANYVYETSIINRTGAYCNLRSKSLPSFPSAMLTLLSGTTFYLSSAGNINITAVNASGSRTNFTYQIKDTKLGYPIAEEHSDFTNQQTFVCVPYDRNYTIMLYPYQSMPVSFAWNNFTATQNFNISGNGNGNNKSFYNVTSKTLHKQFNLTMNMARVSGHINNSNVKGWDSIAVIPYIFEGGNMIHAQYGAMPHNLSSMAGQSDIIEAVNGTYNITLPATVETNNVLIFIAGTNTSAGTTTYYGGFRNISLNYGTANYDLNFTMYSLLGNVAAITLDTFANPPTNKNVTTAKQLFILKNGSNAQMTSTSAHVEVTVDYSSLAALGNNITTTSFTWMTDVAQSQALSNFSVPLISAAGIKEMNIFASGGPAGGTSQYAPKRKTYTVAEIQADSNISLSVFNPGAIDSSVAASSISMALYFSNTTCDVPNPPAVCLIGGSQTMSSFNPMQAVMGGGKLSFRMGYGGILVHYVNVDLMASGPPDAAFDSSATSARTGETGFSSVMRFGSQGPTIYDYVLISMPYTEGGVNGLKDNVPVSMAIPVLYDDSWNVIWNISANGTNMANLAGNYSHYSTYQNAWGNLTAQKVCGAVLVVDSSMMNETNPCSIDTTNNRIWVRLPHFSGTGPSVNGSSSTDSYTVPGDVKLLSPTENDMAYINVNQILINVTTNLSDFQNITLFIFNHSAGLAAIKLNYTYNSSNPTVYLNYSGIPDGMWSFNATAMNSSGFRNSSALRNITIDTALPFIINGSRTEGNGTYIDRNWIYFNVSIREINPANITLYLYNSALTLINTTSYTLGATNGSLNSANNTINWTGLDDGIYYYNASIIDKAGNTNKTPIRMATIDAVEPNLVIASPVSLRTYYSNQTIVISFNSSDISAVALKFANATANITFVDKNWTRYTSAGWYNLTFYANNSASRLTTTLVSFRVIDQPTDVAIANTSTFDVNATGTNIIVPYNYSLQNLSINSTLSSTAYTINLSQILISGNAVISGVSNITLSRADSAGGQYNFTVFIQDNLNISGGAGWDGSIAMPIVNTTSFTPPSGTLSAAISVGSTITELNLTKPAKINFMGFGGKKAAWAKAGVTTLTNIATICDSATNPTNIDATTTRECYFDSGSDLIIWTYHFSTFAAYLAGAATTTTTTTAGSSSAEELFWKLTYYPIDSQLSAGYTKELSSGNRIRFKINNANHYVGVVSVDSTAQTALINVSSIPQQKVMAVGEEWKAEVTGDNYYDIYVKLDSVALGKASLTVKSLSEAIPAAEIPAEETTLTEQIEEKVAEVTAKWSPAKKIIVSIGIILALAVLVIGIIILIQRIRYSKVKEHVKIFEFPGKKR